MKKFSLSLFVFVASAAYVAYQFLGGSPASASLAVATPQQVQGQAGDMGQTADTGGTPGTTPEPAPAPTPKPTPAPTPKPTPAPTPAPAPVPVKPKGQYVDGTYTGSAADAYYGLVQVQAVIQGGRLVGVNFLQYPNDRNTSRQINSQAMPWLKQEAIAAQSARVSGVSGASDTSQAFIESLGSALAKAKNA